MSIGLARVTDRLGGGIWVNIRHVEMIKRCEEAPYYTKIWFHGDEAPLEVLEDPETILKWAFGYKEEDGW